MSSRNDKPIVAKGHTSRDEIVAYSAVSPLQRIGCRSAVANLAFRLGHPANGDNSTISKGNSPATDGAISDRLRPADPISRMDRPLITHGDKHFVAVRHIPEPIPLSTHFTPL